MQCASRNVWWSYPVGGIDMQRINIGQFYQFGYQIHPLSELQPGKPVKEYLYLLYTARAWVDWFSQDNMIPMTICKGSARKIIEAIDRLLPPESEQQNLDKVTEYTDLYFIVDAVKEFETVFAAEVQNMATYFVSKKGIYDTNDLIARADDLFMEDVKKHMSDQARQDIREVGKCLAFDLATAAGFHIARAVEQVLMDYLTILCPNVIAELKDSQRNLGNYIKIARENRGEDKVCSCLDQFRDLHINPLIHPESVLTVDEAMTLLGIAQSAIVAMTMEIEKLKPV
jgi:hypothetical protein